MQEKTVEDSVTINLSACSIRTRNILKTVETTPIIEKQNFGNEYFEKKVGQKPWKNFFSFVNWGSYFT